MSSPNPYEPPRVVASDDTPKAEVARQPHRWVRWYLVVHLLLLMAGTLASLADSRGIGASPILMAGAYGLALMTLVSPVVIIWYFFLALGQDRMWLAVVAEIMIAAVSLFALLPLVQ